jgi:hypothetical protein
MSLERGTVDPVATDLLILAVDGQVMRDTFGGS